MNPNIMPSGWAGVPAATVPVPEVVSHLAAAAPIEAVWQNELGGVTFRIRCEPVLFVKWYPPEHAGGLRDEAARLAWAVAYTPVPRVVGSGEDASGAWLVTEGLPGESAVSTRWKRSPDIAVRAIGAGLRALHDALPLRECPFDWSVKLRLRRAREAGRPLPPDWPPPPPIDRLVVCHGDACAPNTLISSTGTWSAHVDLGELGVADRWADLAIATWSAEWNYGPGWEAALLDAYGVTPHPVHTAYYRRLWDAT